MNVRLHLFSQKWQTVASSFVRRVFESMRRIHPDERGMPTPLDDAKRLHRRADRPRLPRMRVNVDFGIGHALADVVDLRLDGGEVVLRSALENELAAERRQPRNLNDVLPHVLWQHLRETGEHLFFREALFLKLTRSVSRNTAHP